MRLINKLEKNKDFWFLFGTSFLFFWLRFPSLFEPNWYGDEGIYQTLGLAIDKGRILYQGIWDNKPPLLYLLYAVFHSDQFLLRLVSLLSGIGAIITFFFLAKHLFAPSIDGGRRALQKSRKIIYGTTLFFAFLFGIPLIEGNIANAENFMLFPLLLAGYLVYTKRANDTKRKKDLHASRVILSAQKAIFLSGVLVSIAFLFKIVAVFDTAAFFLFLAITGYTDFSTLGNLIKKLIPFVLGFLLPLIVTIIYFVLNHALSDFLRASFVQNVGYVGYGNTFIIPQGLLILKLFLLGSFVVVLFFKRKSLPQAIQFIFLLTGFSLFNAFFSQRPYTHYVLMFLPSFCLLIGVFLWKKKVRLHIAIVIGIILLFVIKGFNFYGKTITYYPNFLSFLLKQKTVNQYQAFFDRNTPRDYALAAFIKANETPSEGLYIWGNNAEVYALTNTVPPGRYTVAYHVTGYKNGMKETSQAIAKSHPKFIIVMPDQGSPPYSLADYKHRLDMDHAAIYEKIF